MDFQLPGCQSLNVSSTRISKRFGVVVKRHRLALGLTQEALAEAAKLHPTYISMVERGVRNPTLDAAGNIANALKVSLSALIAESLGEETKFNRKGDGR
jgi:transcriptional regulator with XRE-family HTH domain